MEESYLRDELRDHEEGQVLKMLKKGLEALRINESDLGAKAKGLEKQVLAWWLRKRTVVNRRWIMLITTLF